MTNGTNYTKSEQQIVDAKRAYITTLKKTAKYRFCQVYTDNGNGLEVLWYKHFDHVNYNHQYFKHQVRTNDNSKLPCVCFKILNSHVSWSGKSEDLQDMLKAYNENIQVFYLDCAAPF
jgi:hypothetical protein